MGDNFYNDLYQKAFKDAFIVFQNEGHTETYDVFVGMPIEALSPEVAEIRVKGIREAQIAERMNLGEPEIFQTTTREQALEAIAAGATKLPAEYDPVYPYVVNRYKSLIDNGKVVSVVTSPTTIYQIKTSDELDDYIIDPANFNGKYN